jgi:GT2 family glycosyltransferase
MNKIAVLIPNYNGSVFIEATVESFQESFPECEIVVVDDASQDDSVAILKPFDTTLLAREKNGGFAAAVNTGLKYLVSQGVPFIIVSNSDVNMNPLIAEEVISYIEDLPADKGVIVGFQEENDPDNERRIGDRVSGFFFGIDSRVVQTIGYLDEKYIMYGEEQDYFKRVERAGLKIIQSNIVIPHEGEKSGAVSLKNSWLALRNALRLEVKFFSIRKLLRTVCVLFLIINRLYRPLPNHSVNRLLRLGVFKGNLFLLSAIVWNTVMMPWTLCERKSEH